MIPDGPIPPVRVDKYKEDPLHVQRIQGYKHEQNKGRSEEDASQSIVAHAFTSILSKFFPNVSKKQLLERPLTFESKMYTHLADVKNHFLQLKENDFSKDPKFTDTFSKSWNFFLQEFTRLSQKESNYGKLEKLIAYMNAYPTRDEHSIGHYLTNYAGEKWLPFPYLELLRKLNRDFLVKGKESDLAHFLHMLSQILGEEN